VVEASLGIPTSYVGMLRWHSAGLFGEPAMAKPWDGVGEDATAEPVRHKRGLLGGCDAHTDGETIVGTLWASGIY
jgi:hypothetical protein